MASYVSTDWRLVGSPGGSGSWPRLRRVQVSEPLPLQSSPATLAAWTRRGSILGKPVNESHPLWLKSRGHDGRTAAVLARRGRRGARRPCRGDEDHGSVSVSG